MKPTDRQVYMNLVATLIPTNLANELKHDMEVRDGNDLDRAANRLYEVSYTLLYNAGKYFERELEKEFIGTINGR